MMEVQGKRAGSKNETSKGLSLGLVYRYNVYLTLGQEMERIGWILMYVLTKYLGDNYCEIKGIFLVGLFIHRS